MRELSEFPPDERVVVRSPAVVLSAANGNVVDTSKSATNLHDSALNACGGKKCGAKRRNGMLCTQSAMPNGRCKFHGGMTPHGEALPQYKHGRYSRYAKDMPALLKSGYKAALADPELLSLKDEVALLETRARELLRGMEATPAPPWGDVHLALGKVNAAIGVGDAEAQRQALISLSEIVVAGANAAVAYESCWAKLLDLVDRKAKVAGAEWKRMTELNAVVSVEDCMGFLRALMSAAKEVITDPKQFQALQRKTLSFMPSSVEGE